MASGKRASMREGPLSQLFRKSDEGEPEREEAHPAEGTQAVPSEPPQAQSRREPPQEPRQAQSRREPYARPFAEPRTADAEDPLPAETLDEPHLTEAASSEPGSREGTHGAPRATEAARRSEAARRAEERRRQREARDEGWSRSEGVPSPEERLRHVFSADIPENILERTPPPERVAAVRHPEPELHEHHVTSAGVAEPTLRVVGVGGAGVNAVNRMIEAGVEGVDFIAVNTDTQSLEQSAASTCVHIGGELTRGLGSGSDPELGKAAAMEQYDELKGLLKGSDMVFITAGAGGGTGTGAAPIVARISREVGALTVGIVTKPFQFEGARRGDQAERGVDELSHEVDTLITIPNARLLTVLDKKTSMVEAFRVADDVLRQGVQGISDLITLPGLINLDFADVRTIMSQAGQALLGIGMGTGERRAMDAVEHAIESPLLETSLEGARSILLSITGGRDISLWEVNEAAKAVSEAAHPDANIIFGAMVDDKVVDQVWVTVVATGYGERPQRRSSTRGERIPADAEPRVRRARERVGAPSLGEVDVPEFMPRR